VTPKLETLQGNQLINQLLGELRIIQPSDLVVSYRGNYRWVQTFEPVHLDKTPTANKQLREGGVYLITGGLGGIGLLVAKYLAQTARAKLVLIGRSGLPKKEEWEQWLTNHGVQNDISDRIRKVQALEALGAEVLVIEADVANETQMQAAITQASACFGEIHGVVHAAGLTLSGTIQGISRAECEQQFRPTVQGIFVLEKILQGKQLDFCLLTSSLASILGKLGMAAYPATHLFTDAFTYKHNQTNSIPWIAVNWDNWLTSAADELGMKPEASELVMTPDEGLEVLQRVLSLRGVPQIIISTGNLQARIDQWLKGASLQNQESSKPETVNSLHARPNLQNTYVAPRNEVEQTIANIWQQLLGIEFVGIHDNFFELGGDSVIGIQLIARLNQAGLELTPKQLFEHQTIAELAQMVDTILRSPLINNCQSPDTGGSTPSDFSLVQLSEDELEKAFGSIEFEED
jgi:NADP-dependent 3-hydroxy acid dehydrogenase YdfG/aryl carrier-like protein